LRGRGWCEFFSSLFSFLSSLSLDTTCLSEANVSVCCSAVFECTESGPFAINRVMSRDDGRTWGERARVYTAAHGRDAGAPQVYNVGGTLVASFMTNEGVGGLDHLDGGQMKVVTSVDGGRSWNNAVAGSPAAVSGAGGVGAEDGGAGKVKATVTGETGSHWPGLFALPGGKFLALYSRDGVGAVSQVYKLG